MNKYSKETLIKIQKELDLNCPSPETNLTKLGQCVATLPNSEVVAKLRRLVLDIDDLTAQIRWHLGQALLIMCPQWYLYAQFGVILFIQKNLICSYSTVLYYPVSFHPLAIR